MGSRGDLPRTPESVRPSGNGQPILVVHVVISLQIGGLENVVVHLVKGARRVRTHVICLETTGALAAKLEGSAATVECIGTPTTPVLASVRALRARLAELRPDVLHTHNEKPHIHGALATIGWRRPPLVHTRHGRGQVDTALSRAAHRIAVHRSRFIVCVSADAVAVATSEGAREEQLRVLLNGIDVSAYDAAQYEQHAGSWRAVTVARLAPVKDIATMLRAARRLADINSAFRLDVVGDGESKPDLEALTRQLHLQDVVTFHGATTDPRPHLEKASIFLQSSVSEGISLTLLEAMAAGLPIVATEVGGNREVVERGVTGELVPAQDPAALAAAAEQLLASPARALAMSRAARSRAERLFDTRSMVDSYESLYEEALKV